MYTPFGIKFKKKIEIEKILRCRKDTKTNLIKSSGVHTFTKRIVCESNFSRAKSKQCGQPYLVTHNHVCQPRIHTIVKFCFFSFSSRFFLSFSSLFYGFYSLQFQFNFHLFTFLILKLISILVR